MKRKLQLLSVFFSNNFSQTNKNIDDLYSLYGTATAVTPDPKPIEQEEDLFGEAQGAVIQEEKHEDHEEDGFDDFGKIS